MKIAKACVTGLLSMAGLACVYKGYDEYTKGDIEEGNKYCYASFIYSIPAMILGFMGWNFKKAFEK